MQMGCRLQLVCDSLDDWTLYSWDTDIDCVILYAKLGRQVQELGGHRSK